MASSRQGSLREFQARLTEKLRVAASMPTRQSRLGLMIGQDRYLVKLEDAGEIVPVPAMTSVPLTADWFRGVCNLRGSLHSVTDLNRFGGGTFTVLDRDSRLLALGGKLNFNAGILVTRMLGLRSVDQMTVSAPANDDSWRGAVMKDADGVTWQEINLGSLARDEKYLLVGRG